MNVKTGQCILMDALLLFYKSKTVRSLPFGIAIISLGERTIAARYAYMTAWMLYTLCGDAEAGEVFVGANAELPVNKN